MPQTERDALKVDVPVGFLLAEPREILVSVDRPADVPLAIRLRLIPAETDARPDFGAMPPRSLHDTPPPTRRLSRVQIDDGYPNYDYGGGD